MPNGDGTGSTVDITESVGVVVFEAGELVWAAVSSSMLDGDAVGVTDGLLDEASVGIMVGVLDWEKTVGVTVDGTEGVRVTSAEVENLVGAAVGSVFPSCELDEDNAVGFIVCTP